LIGFDKTMYEKGMQIFTQGGRVDSLRKASAPDSLVTASYFAMEGTANDLKNFTQDFLAKSNSPILSLYAIGSYQNTVSNLGIKGFSRTEIASVVNNTAAKFPQHAGLQAVKKSLPSNKAADFTQPDVNGNPVSLSQFKGKYVLVDFWASWCQPCRIDNPNVVRAFNEFKDKNFTILGVSLDQNKDAWQKAIQKDGLTWTHVSDLKFWDNAAATLYGVQGIPYNVLVDPQGNIIAENLHGEEIVQTLRQVIK
jgi:peroxiredoxin